MAFIGAEFEEKDGGGVELIHSNWCTPRKKEVFWPPYKTKSQFQAALKKGVNPDENDWKLYSINRIFFSTGEEVFLVSYVVVYLCYLCTYLL